MLDHIKFILRDQLGLPAWGVLIAVGLASHLALSALLRKPVTSSWGLLAPLALGVAVESYEIWVQYRDAGLFAEGNDPVWQIIARHGLDVATMLALPLLLVLAGLSSAR